MFIYAHKTILTFYSYIIVIFCNVPVVTTVKPVKNGQLYCKLIGDVDLEATEIDAIFSPLASVLS